MDTILCIDVGGGSIKAAEYSAGVEEMTLESFAFCEYTTENDDTTFEPMLAALREVISANNFNAEDVYVSVSGNDVYFPFVKVPSLTRDPQKIKEIIAYEASQRIPYPISEVVWDYQIIDAMPGEDAGGEIDAMLVSAKNDFVTVLTQGIEALGKKVRNIECAPTAIFNCGRANGVGDTQCEMILNIGARCSTLIFLDGNRFFMRPIPTGGNTITQQIAKEFNMSFADAEEIKRRHGFVALGGAYEEPESDVAATVSKIVRNVMTRLHGEINRSINVYRATQHGRKPEKLYLTGGSSIMAFTPRFFVEKLRIPVDYFNPFQVVGVGAAVNRDTLSEAAHLFSEVIGLSLRHIRSTPIEISLIPDSILKQRAIARKTPFFYASAVALLAYLGISCWTLYVQANDIKAKSDSYQERLSARRAVAERVRKTESDLNKEIADFATAGSMIGYRDNFIVFFNHLQSSLPENMWITEVSLGSKADYVVDAAAPKAAGNSLAPRGYGRRSPMGPVRADDGDETLPMAGAAQQNADLAYLNIKGCIIINESSANEAYSKENIALDCFSRFTDNLRKPDALTGVEFFPADKDVTYIPLELGVGEKVMNISAFSASIKLSEPLNKLKIKEKSEKKLTEQAVAE